ncbi:hypothetical protein CYMTET_31562 [Cymbomonas tetramitiformis]|uniref:Uncharacterized protein n=1 Tax=Cymbomonas tetramitiformis TaxID=36881 RepID=A0AAE0KSS0_9CHLO|nr:hypothetical protein CYMTET_31562 [Cymbomonas tetramitiformis]
MAAGWQLSESANGPSDYPNLLRLNATSRTAGVQDTSVAQSNGVLSESSEFPPQNLPWQVPLAYYNWSDPAESSSDEINYNPESRLTTTMRLPLSSPLPAFRNDTPMEQHNLAPWRGEEEQTAKSGFVSCPSRLLELTSRTAEASNFNNFFSQWVSCETGVTPGPELFNDGKDTGITNQGNFDEVPNSISAAEITPELFYLPEDPDVPDRREVPDVSLPASIINQQFPAIFQAPINASTEACPDITTARSLNDTVKRIPPRSSTYQIKKRSSSKTLSAVNLMMDKLLLPNETTEANTVKAAYLSGRTNRVPRRTLINKSFQKFWKVKGKHTAVYRQILPKYEDRFPSADEDAFVVDQNDKRKFILKQLKVGWSSWPLFKDFDNFQISDFEARFSTEEIAQRHQLHNNGQEMTIYDITYNFDERNVSDREESSAAICKSKLELYCVMRCLLSGTQTFLEITGETDHTNVHYDEDPIWAPCCNALFQGFMDEIDDKFTYYDRMKRHRHGK